jgi:hypothetical protein
MILLLVMMTSIPLSGPGIQDKPVVKLSLMLSLELLTQQEELQ